jgi:hypothetical protein
MAHLALAVFVRSPSRAPSVRGRTCAKIPLAKSVARWQGDRVVLGMLDTVNSRNPSVLTPAGFAVLGHGWSASAVCERLERPFRVNVGVKGG